MPESRFHDHCQTIARTIEAALEQAAARDPEWAEDMYFVGAETDGQYLTVTVGVSNFRDETIELNTDDYAPKVTS